MMDDVITLAPVQARELEGILATVARGSDELAHRARILLSNLREQFGEAEVNRRLFKNVPPDWQPPTADQIVKRVAELTKESA